MELLNCKRCGHNWYRRKLRLPDRCAKCNVKHWDRPKRVPAPFIPAARVGRPNKYRVDILNIGQGITIPYETSAEIPSIKQAIHAYGRRHGKRFAIAGAVEGLKIKRLI